MVELAPIKKISIMASLVVQGLKNPPCFTGHRFSHWFGKVSYTAGKLSPCITTTELVCASPEATTTEALEPTLRNKKPPQ